MVIKVSRTLIILIAFACLVLGAFSAKQLFAAFIDKPVTLASLQLLPEPKPLPQVMLRTAMGEPFTREKFQRQWSLVFFGFTSCPDFCPLELHKLSKLLKMARGNGNDLQVIFVSVDPERDSAERLAEYLAFFHPHIIGLRGDNPAVANFARFFGAAYERTAIIDNKVLSVPAGAAMPAIAGEQYQVNHSTRVFVVDSQAQYIGSVANTESAELLWADLQKLL